MIVSILIGGNLYSQDSSNAQMQFADFNINDQYSDKKHKSGCIKRYG